MLIYLDPRTAQVKAKCAADGKSFTSDDLRQAIMEARSSVCDPR